MKIPNRLDIQPECACGRKLAKIHASTIATEEVKRTCRACGYRWSVLVKPMCVLRRVGGFAHDVTLRPNPKKTSKGTER